MFGPSFGTRVSHYNPDEPRDDHGRWTTGGSSWRKNLLRDPSPIGRARTFLGHGLVGAFQQGLIRNIAYPTPAEGKRMSHLLAAWTMAACLDDQSFHEHFTDGLVHGIERAGALLAEHFPAEAGPAGASPDTVEEVD